MIQALLDEVFAAAFAREPWQTDTVVRRERVVDAMSQWLFTAGIFNDLQCGATVCNVIASTTGRRVHKGTPKLATDAIQPIS